MTKVPTLYFDYNATSPVDPRVLEAMLPYFSQYFGNSLSSTHSFGWDAEKAVEKARKQVAELINCETKEIVFTSGATESNNWVIEGVLETVRAEEGPQAPLHLLISPLEHNSVLQAAQRAKKVFGAEVDFLPINSYGQVDIRKIPALLKPHTRLLAAMWVQNEIGSINPVDELAEFCHQHRIYFLSDATQAIGKVPVDLKKSCVDLVSFSAHKMSAPKGIGFLYMRSKEPKIQLPPLICGGGHEHGYRSGTVNVPSVVGIGRACEIILNEGISEQDRFRSLRDSMLTDLKKTFPSLRLNGHPTDRSPNNLHLTFLDTVVPSTIPGLALSRGSACLSGRTTMSHVLTALNFTEEEASQTLRLSLGRATTTDEIRQAVAILEKHIKAKHLKS